MRQAAIFDIDGTLASSEWRSPLAEAKQWDRFHEGIPYDTPIPTVVHELRRHREADSYILLVTNRTDAWREETENWLVSYEIDWDLLLMRSTEQIPWRGSDLKRWQYRNHIMLKYDVTAVYEDHKMIVPMWREELPHIDIPLLTDPGFPPLFMGPHEVADWIAARLPSGTVV